MAAFRIFVSSVQKELEDERLIVQNLISTAPFLSAHCVPVLYELEPASPAKALDSCLESLDGCNNSLRTVFPTRITSLLYRNSYFAVPMHLDQETFTQDFWEPIPRYLDFLRSYVKSVFNAKWFKPIIAPLAPPPP